MIMNILYHWDILIKNKKNKCIYLIKELNIDNY